MYRLAQKMRLSILAVAVALTASMLVSACASSAGDPCDANHSCCTEDGLTCGANNKLSRQPEWHAESMFEFNAWSLTGVKSPNSLLRHCGSSRLCEGRVQLGIKALDGTYYNEATDHLTAALSSSNLSSKSDIHEIYEDLLFGWDLKSLWLTAHQKHYEALLRAASTEECGASFLASGDAALAVNDHDSAIDLYSAAIDLDFASDIVFTHRSKKVRWHVTELNPSSHVEYHLTHTALRGAQRYDEAIEAFTIVLSKLEIAPEARVRELRQQYFSPSAAGDVIQRTVWMELENALLCLLNTSTGLSCDRAAQIHSFQMSPEYNELVSFPTKDSNFQTEHIKDVGRDGGTAACIQDKVVYELNDFGGITKLQSFCKIARDAGPPAIMKALEDATGIDAQALVTFRPGMNGAREKLQWASKRVTTVQDDVAYSLFGIFRITLPVIYGEKKQHALVRLLQEIVAQSGDITVLDWIGQPSEFNKCKCLPAHTTSYTTPPRTPPPLSEDQIQTQVSPLEQIMGTGVALKLHDQLEQLRASRFANCRLHLPCISFCVTEVRWRRDLAQETPITYRIKADGLQDLLIATEETLVQFSRENPIRQTFLLVRPWDRYLLGVPGFAEQADFTDDMESIGDWTEPGSPTDDSWMDDSNKLPSGSAVEEEPGSRALQLMVHLGQPFDAFLLGQQRVGEYKRIASDNSIVAQVKDLASVDHIDVGTIVRKWSLEMNL
ncbi:hypothetical protein BDR07DRAFT_1461248 [Suillus spraguei]|nr:hypothetical protein BDR07DRAFT_1461248 [Suillus spraguei]